MLIVFEGIDGSGKDTQIGKLLSFLRQHRVKYKLRKYPTRKAKEAYAHLAGRKTVPPLKLARIFADDIAAEQGKIALEIEEGYVVICDRYLHSTLAYQGVGAGFVKLKEQLGAYGIISPDLVLLLDIDAGAGAARKGVQKTPDRHERDAEFLSKVRQNYLREAKENFLAYKFVVVDGSRPEDEIFTEVVTQVEPLLTKKMGK